MPAFRYSSVINTKGVYPMSTIGGHFVISCSYLESLLTKVTMNIHGYKKEFVISQMKMYLDKFFRNKWASNGELEMLDIITYQGVILQLVII